MFFKKSWEKKLQLYELDQSEPKCVFAEILWQYSEIKAKGSLSPIVQIGNFFKNL